MPRYLDYLLRRLSAAGGTLEIRRLTSLTDALDVAPVVVNCTGLGARDLAGDTDVRPVFGQHVMLTNPGLDQLVIELTLEHTKNNKTRAAEILGISQKTLFNKLREYGAQDGSGAA
jgi:transcriptional regulator with AAA-type ATPase domain